MTKFTLKADSAVGTWIDARELRVGDVYSHCGPGARSPMIEQLVKSLRVSYSPADFDGHHASHVVVVNCSFPGKVTKPAETDKMFAYDSSLGGACRVFLVRRVTRQEDVARLERELTEARENLEKQREAERAARIDAAARVLTGHEIVHGWAKRAAKSLDDAGLLAG